MEGGGGRQVGWLLQQRRRARCAHTTRPPSAGEVGRPAVMAALAAGVEGGYMYISIDRIGGKGEQPQRPGVGAAVRRLSVGSLGRGGGGGAVGRGTPPGGTGSTGRPHGEAAWCAPLPSSLEEGGGAELPVRRDARPPSGLENGSGELTGGTIDRRFHQVDPHTQRALGEASCPEGMAQGSTGTVSLLVGGGGGEGGGRPSHLEWTECREEEGGRSARPAARGRWRAVCVVALGTAQVGVSLLDCFGQIGSADLRAAARWPPTCSRRERCVAC